MTSLLRELRVGLRVLLKRPGFTLVTVLTLGVSIGINTAVFSVVYAALVRQLPFAAPERLFAVAAENKRGGVAEIRGVAPADFVDWRAQSRSFDALAAYTGGGLTLDAGGEPEQISGVRVSDDFFKALGVRAAVGRLLDADDFGAGASGRPVVLSQRLWRRRFGGDPRVVGSTLKLMGGASATVVGVMPEEFKFPSYAEVWSPLPRESGELRQRTSRYFSVVGLLKEGVTREQAQEEMAGVAARLAETYPQSNADWGVRLIPLGETLVGKAREALLILFGAVLFVLAIACANVANLLLSRATARRKEVAIRTALGATRWRVVRQLLVESVLLALMGGAAGLVLALWGVDVLVSLVPEALRFARLDEARVDGAVLAFTAGVSLLTGVLTGLLPGLKVSRAGVGDALKETGRGASAGGRLKRARAALVVAEIAVTLVLLVGAGLLVRSFVSLQRADLGFDPRNKLTLVVSPPQQLYGQPEKLAEYYRRMQERLAALPGVRAVASASSLPLDWVLNFSYGVEGRPSRPGEDPQADYASVSPNYFEVMGVPLVRGRGFTERDAAGTPAVAVVNESFARRVFPGEDPVGKRVTIDYMERRLSLEVVGVAGDVRQTVGQEPNIQIYDCYLQRPWLSSAFILSTEGDPAALAGAAQAAVREVDRGRAAADVKPMERLLAEAVAQPLFYTRLLSLFALVALLLAAVGVYGVMSYSASQRTHEIGVRIALGARGRDVIGMVVGQGMALALTGVAIGVACALALTRVMSGLLYGVTATDPATFAGVALLLMTVALLACYVPARRATKVDPMVALRHE